MNRKLWRILILVFALLLLFSDGLLVAQEPPPAEEPGAVAQEVIASPEALGARADVSAIDAAFSGGPHWDSGWVSLDQDEARTLTHNLGGNTDHYVVDMQYWMSGSNGINQRYYGGADFGAKSFNGTREDERVGAYWRSLTTSTITVYRRAEDDYAPKVRLRIWVDPYPNWDSSWQSLTPGAAATVFNHGLGGNSDDYVVDMQFRSGGSGVNQRYYGGADFGALVSGSVSPDDRVGAYWRSLTNTAITVFRRAEDGWADDVRVRIWVRPKPTWDSGWVAVNQDQARTLAHNIGGNPKYYVVDMQYRTSGVNGVNQRYYGGADFGAHVSGAVNPDDRVGAYWRSLTDSSITVYRRPEDIYAEEIRVRIWNFWKPTVPDYDSGWRDVTPGAATTLTHNVGGDTDDYLVDMQYRTSGVSGVNQRYYGGADFGSHVSGSVSPDDRVSAYWRSLTNSSITVFRRAEDIYAEQIRIRIWVMPQPEFDSGWVALAQDTSQTFNHNLGYDFSDYLVDLQFRSSGSSGVHQRYYGGADFGTKVSSAVNPDDQVGVYWRTLDNSSITVYRRPEDHYADEVRVRIWRTARPDYETGWAVVAQDDARTFAHNLGGSVDDYFVNMVYYDSTFNYINQRHLGGADFGVNPPGGYNADDRVGAYWRTLTDSEITAYRRAEDGFADLLRIRIWVADVHKVYLPTVLRHH